MGITDQSAASAAQDAFFQVFAKSGIGSLPIEIIEMKYGYKDLLRWKKEALGASRIEGVNSFDVREDKNRIVIGLSDLDQSQGILDMLKTVPDDAISFEERQPAKRLARLTDKFHPMAGGIQVKGYDAPYSITCTFGINVERSGVYGMITASHCTNRYESHFRRLAYVGWLLSNCR